jgi:hypothetical protein
MGCAAGGARINDPIGTVNVVNAGTLLGKGEAGTWPRGQKVLCTTTGGPTPPSFRTVTT